MTPANLRHLGPPPVDNAQKCAAHLLQLSLKLVLILLLQLGKWALEGFSQVFEAVLLPLFVRLLIIILRTIPRCRVNGPSDLPVVQRLPCDSNA